MSAPLDLFIELAGVLRLVDLVIVGDAMVRATALHGGGAARRSARRHATLALAAGAARCGLTCARASTRRWRRGCACSCARRSPRASGEPQDPGRGRVGPAEARPELPGSAPDRRVQRSPSRRRSGSVAADIDRREEFDERGVAAHRRGERRDLQTPRAHDHARGRTHCARGRPRWSHCATTGAPTSRSARCSWPGRPRLCWRAITATIVGSQRRNSVLDVPTQQFVAFARAPDPPGSAQRARTAPSRRTRASGSPRRPRRRTPPASGRCRRSPRRAAGARPAASCQPVISPFTTRVGGPG